MKRCQIYKTNSKYKILAEFKSREGLFITSEPIYILEQNSSLLDLTNAIFECLRATRPSFNAPLGKIEYKEFSKEILSKLHEKSFDALGKNNKSCQVIFDNEKIFIYPMMWKDRIGLVWEENKKSEFDLMHSNEIDITKEVLKLLK